MLSRARVADRRERAGRLAGRGGCGPESSRGTRRPPNIFGEGASRPIVRRRSREDAIVYDEGERTRLMADITRLIREPGGAAERAPRRADAHWLARATPAERDAARHRRRRGARVRAAHQGGAVQDALKAADAAYPDRGRRGPGGDGAHRCRAEVARARGPRRPRGPLRGARRCARSTGRRARPGSEPALAPRPAR